MHRGDARPPRNATWGLLWQLYLLPMQEHVERIFSYIRDNSLLDRKTKQPQANAIQRTLLDLIGSLVRYQLKLEAPWPEVKEMLKEVNIELTDEDLELKPGGEKELLERLSRKMNKSVPEDKTWIESVSFNKGIAG